MANIEIFEFPENVNPDPVDIVMINNEFEPGHVAEKVSFSKILGTAKKLTPLAVPVAADFVAIVPPADADASSMTMQALSDFLATLQPPAAIPTRQQVYDASGTGLINVLVGKPGGWASITEGVLGP